MIGIIEKFHQDIEKPGVDEKKFSIILQNYYEELYHLKAENSRLFELTDKELNEIIQRSFEGRLKLIKKLNDFIPNREKEDKTLLTRVYDMTRALRYLEDYVLEVAMRDKLSTKQAYITLQGEPPYFMVAPGQQLQNLEDLQSGDIILTRGNAFTSAAIARIGVNDTQFSHLSFLYRNPKEGGKLYTIEAHIEIGSVVAPIEVHIDQKNSRTVVYRFEDSEMAHKAAQYMFHKVKTQADKGKNIEYNFSMQYQDATRLFCSQVIYDGFYEVSSQTIDIPKFKTKFNLGLIEFLNQLGVPVTAQNIDKLDTFSPGDIEYDPRFTLIAEWKDPKQLRDSRIKDAILTKMFAWMDHDQYHIHPPLGIALKSQLTWILRRTPGIKKFLVKKLPMNMNIGQMKMFLTLDKIGGVLKKEVLAVREKKKEPLTLKEIFDSLEAFKNRDKDRTEPLFHHWLHQKE